MNDEKKEIVARVGDKEFTNDDFQQFITTLEPKVLQHFMSKPDGFKTLINELVNQELMLIYAKENNFEAEEEFKEGLEHTKNNLLKTYAYSKVINSADKVSEKEIEEYYKEHKEDFNKPFVNASHILVKTLEEADAALKRINDGEIFEDIASEVSTCPSAQKGGNLGDFTKGQMVPEFDEAVFSMSEGEIKGPVKTQFGYHLIKLNKINSVQSAGAETAKDEIKTELTRRKQLDAYLTKIEELKKSHSTQIMI